MRCVRPIQAWQPDDGGKLVFSERANHRPLTIRCGQCIGCRLHRSCGWAIRCLHESQMHKWSSFITLTYNDEFVPVDRSLRYSDFQKFMRRCRKHFRCERQRIRFFMCGEYGDDFGRPHFHACLFGAFFPDRVLFKRSDSGSNVYTSEILSKLWSDPDTGRPIGFASVGDVTFESAAYVARYVVKKVTGNAADEHYKFVTSDGEVCWRVPEFTRMSLKPGIGADWFKKYWPEVYPRDHVIVGGRKLKPPRYYDRLLAANESDLSEYLEFLRYVKSGSTDVDNTEDRLRAIEIVAKARLRFKVRTLE